MTTEFKLVPVETLKFALGIARHGFKNRTDQEADKYTALKTITEILESPTPPQPIYDEAKERELFEAAFPIEQGSPIHCHVGNKLRYEGWLACAQSRAKAGEVDHE